MDSGMERTSDRGIGPEIAEMFRVLYAIIEHLKDEQKQATSFDKLFLDSEEKRSQLLLLCMHIIFKDYKIFGKKARKIMWRNGFYEFITYVMNNGDIESYDDDCIESIQPTIHENIQFLEGFLCAGIVNYKFIVAKMEQLYDLNLKYLIDFSIISGNENAEGKYVNCDIKKNCANDDGAVDRGIAVVVPHVGNKSLEAISFALETIYSSLLNLGDLHRYFIELPIESKVKINKQLAAKYYFEAFKLYPASGEAHNKLGTLFCGQNFNLDSIYYYMYSLISMVPFEASEENLCKLLRKPSEYLKRIRLEKIGLSLKDFYTRLYQIVDIFFFDKDVPDLNSQCHFVLVDLRKILCSKEFAIDEPDIFKIVSTLFFCLSKLKTINSQKVDSLNEFIVAVCSELIDACIIHIEHMILAKSAENADFDAMYAKKFNNYSTLLRKSRNKYKKRKKKIDKYVVPNRIDNHCCDFVQSGSSDEAKENIPSLNLYSDLSERKNCISLEEYEQKSNEEVLSLASNSKVLKFHCISNVEDCTSNLTPGTGSDILSLVDAMAMPISSQLLPVAPSSSMRPPKLPYCKKYKKINPNTIVEFVRQEPTMRAIRLVFDWLRINNEILIDSLHSNPEFIHKTMKLINYCNIDIFTRKVYFEREFLVTPHVRTAIADLHDVRSTVPLSEDFMFKNFDIFQDMQNTLDWETTIRERITAEEECILRISKIVDFGFFICRHRNFNYNFCMTVRRFTENIKEKCKDKKPRGRRERQTAENAVRQYKENISNTRRYSDRSIGAVDKNYTSNEGNDTMKKCKKIPRKVYPRSHNTESSVTSSIDAAQNVDGGNEGTSASTSSTAPYEKNLIKSGGGDDERSRKSKIMGKLWLENEVAILEEKLRKSAVDMIMTMFIVVDAEALTEYNGIVQNLVNSKKFVVVIPYIVLNELDELKKHSKNARHAIRWLEQEFKLGNRHVRAQGENEHLPISLVHITRNLDRDATIFLKIAQCCNHLVANHSDSVSMEFKKNIVTYLFGDSQYEKLCVLKNLCFTNILDNIFVRYDQIASFYAKFKANNN